MTEQTGPPMQSEMHTLTGAYAVNALPDDERDRFEIHLRQCDPCAQEVAELTATAGRLGRAVAAPAPAAMRARVLAEVQTVRQVSPLGGSVASLSQAREARAWYRQPLGIAASILAVVALGLGVTTIQAQQRAEDARRLAARVAAVATDPARQTVTRPVGSGGTATVVAAGGQALFSARGLPELPDRRTYQLWVIDGGGPRSAGLLRRGSTGSVQRFVPAVRPGDRLAVTVEPRGGSTSPTTDPITLVPLST